MAHYFLNKLFLSLNPSKDIKNSIQNSLLDCFERVAERIKLEQKEKNEFLTKKSKLSDFESERSTTPDVLLARKLYLAEFKEKVRKNKNFAIKLMKEQKDRLLKRQERAKFFSKKLSQELENQEKQKIEEQQKKEEEKQKNLEKMRILSEKRKEVINYYKEINNSKNSNSARPLYKLLEDNFVYNVEMPELERRKRELQRKREFYKPISLQELVKHAKKVENLKEELKEKRKKDAKMKNFEEKIHSVSCNWKSKFIEDVIKKDKNLKEEEIRKNIQKSSMKCSSLLLIDLKNKK